MLVRMAMIKTTTTTKNKKTNKQKTYKQYVLETEYRKGNPLALLVGM